MPTALSSRPILKISSRYYYSIFISLNASRTYGAMGGIFPISMSELEAYVRYFKIDDLQERLDIFRLVSVCDREYVRLMNEKAASDSKSKS